MDLSPAQGVGTIDLNLNNPWWDEIITKYMTQGSFEKWFISTIIEDKVTFRSQYIESVIPPSTADYVIDPVPDTVANATETTKDLRKQFEDDIYPLCKTGKNVYTTYQDWDVDTNSMV